VEIINARKSPRFFSRSAAKRGLSQIVTGWNNPLYFYTPTAFYGKTMCEDQETDNEQLQAAELPNVLGLSRTKKTIGSWYRAPKKKTNSKVKSRPSNRRI
jgi:hypothetical protein